MMVSWCMLFADDIVLIDETKALMQSWRFDEVHWKQKGFDLVGVRHSF